MKYRLHKLFLIAISLYLGAALLSGCETTQGSGSGGVNMNTILGSAAGSILPVPVPADSIARTATAVGKTFQDITPEQEYYIGRAVAANVLATYRPYENGETTRYINLVGQTLAQASDRPETFGGYHFLVVDSPEVNAFAAPGGLILVTRGMVRLCKNEDQLAAVLAHEVAHVQGQHGLRSIKSSRLNTAFTVLAVEAVKSAGPAQLGQLTEAFEGSITDVTSTLMNNGYSRDLEREADRNAVTILQRVGYDPGALVVMLTEMQKQVKPGGPGFGKTHPDPKDRIQEVASYAGNKFTTREPAARQKRFESSLSAL